MVWLPVVAYFPGPNISELDRLAKQRDVAGLSSYVENLRKGEPNPLNVLKTNGAYECGKFGWNAFEMRSRASGKVYVVLSTPLTSEDTGEFLFLREGGRLRLVSEDDALGVHIVRHKFKVNLERNSKAVDVTDSLSIRTSGTGDFFFRMSPEFKVSKVTDMKGVEVGFAQAGGVTVLDKPASGAETLTIQYHAVIDRPTYSASIGEKEATLTNCYWYPMIARQPAPYEVTASYPPEWSCIGQGVKLNEAPGQTTYRMDLPCIFYSLSAGPYVMGKISEQGRQFFAWSPRLSVGTLRTQAETYPSIIRFYERFGKFPFQSYGGLDSPGYGGGALEAYSYATYGGGFPYVDAHEPSHTWWGGILDNTYLHSFWNESFAVYSDELYHRSWSGSEANRLAFIPVGEVSESYDKFACSKSGAFVGPPASDLGYGKGSHVLFMLEKLIGQSVLERAMRKFVADQPTEKAAEWEDFERAAETICPDRHLESFFKDWLDRPGHLAFDASVKFQNGELLIDYKVKGEPYRVPLEVLGRFPDGRTKTMVLDVRQSGVYRLKLDSKPQFVSLDPFRFLVRKVEENETPLDLESAKQKLRVVVDPSHPEWAKTFEPGSESMPSKPEGTFFVASPESSPMVAALFKRVGFEVTGARLSYKGRMIDLNHGAAEAVIDLGNGRLCGIGIGRTRIPLEPGTARVGIFDDLGRLLDGEVSPKLSGNLTYKL